MPTRPYGLGLCPVEHCDPNELLIVLVKLI
jgi:hypothetical protein